MMTRLPRKVLFLTADTAEDWQIAKCTSKLLMICLAVNMIMQSGFIAYKLYEVFQIDFSIHSPILFLFLCYVMWIFISVVGGISGVYAALSPSITAAYICSLAWMAMMVCQIVEVVVSIVYIAPSSQFARESKKLLIMDTIALCFIEMIFIFFIQIFISVYKSGDEHLTSSSSYLSDAYVPLMVEENQDDAPTAVFHAQPIVA